MSIVKEKTKQKIKCVVWDLDNTLWNGTLVEDENVEIKNEVIQIIKELDNRGILQSIASKNYHELAMKKLEEFGIKEYFLYPQINWGPKSESINNIAKLINIGVDTLAFVDDQSFELEEVKFTYEEVLCIDTNDIDLILDMDEIKPKFITEDSKYRRSMYLSDIKRNKIEEKFNGTKDEFLESLNMKFTILEAKEDDLKRVEELTVRTHQLNTSGYTYSYDELKEFIESDKYKLLVAGLEDKFGDYGKIGLTLLECSKDIWTIKLFIMSCRVMSRGVGSILINYIMNLAKENNVILRAEFIHTDKNRMMYVTYKFAGFKENGENQEVIYLENSLENIQSFPKYVEINC